MKKIIFILLIISYTFGNFIDGNYLYTRGLEYNKIQLGRNGNYLESSFYEGYVLGAFDNGLNGLSFCSPNNIKAEQVFDIVFKYLRKHPGIRNKLAGLLVIEALQKTWPCKWTKKKSK